MKSRQSELEKAAMPNYVGVLRGPVKRQREYSHAFPVLPSKKFLCCPTSHT